MTTTTTTTTTANSFFKEETNKDPLQKPKISSLCLRSLKQTYDLFRRRQLETGSFQFEEDFESKRLKVNSKILEEYRHVKDLPPPQPQTTAPTKEQTTPQLKPEKMEIEGNDFVDNEGRVVVGSHNFPSGPGVTLTEETAQRTEVTESSFKNLLESLPSQGTPKPTVSSGVLDIYRGATQDTLTSSKSSTALAVRGPSVNTSLKPKWHPPWKLMRVISGHIGWVRSIAVDRSNEWFCTGSSDNTIKIWDLASGTLRLTLTGHIGAVRGLVVSPRHPYLFSVAEDKMVKCWDLEYNKVIRHYHGHLSGVYSITLHPTIDIIVTGGRDSVARVWDIRTKGQIHVLSGHTSSVNALISQPTDPQIISGSADSTIRTWDLAKGRTISVLTHHKKGVRALLGHPEEYTFASAAADNIKKWKLPEAQFIANLSGHRAILNTLAINQDNVLVSGADNGTLYFWDWKSGYSFQQLETIPQPGSLQSEAGIFAATFDMSGSRLFTCEADKTIKVYKEDETATEETHPINWKPSKQKKKY